MAEVKNVKISLKVKGSSLDNAVYRLSQLKISYKHFTNYITFNKVFTFIYFKSKDGVLNHINVTKLKVKSDISSAVNILKHLFQLTVVKIKVDNIIATYDTTKSIDLIKLIENRAFKLTKYNPEQFPGLFVKYPQGTVIVFHSGKLVLVGFKVLKSLKSVLKEVCVTIMK